MNDDEFDAYLKKEQIKNDYRSNSYEDTIRQNHVPAWRCPYCQRQGTLKLKDDNLSHIETNESKQNRLDEDFDHEWLRFVSSIYLVCSYCNDVTTVLGKGMIDTFEEYPEYEADNEKNVLIQTSAGGQWSELAIHPQFFYPTIHLFEIPQNTPKEIKEKIIESFSLAWCDYSAAGNKIRIAIELFVNEMDIILPPKKSPTLGNKINTLENEQPDIFRRLNAIRWLGNQGSHADSSLQSCDIGIAYAAFEKLLVDKYGKNIDQLIDKINEQKRSPL